jgi:transcriptional regulator with XRE-family HTH domain
MYTLTQEVRTMNLGERVHLLRRRLGWTQKELAELSKVNLNNIARIERSEIRDPGGSVVARMARALGTSTDYLLGLTEESGVESERKPAAVAEVGA